jgi:hypothetical protein
MSTETNHCFVIQVVGPVLGPPSGIEGEYIVAFDPDANLGRGELVTNRDVAKAKQFGSPEDAFRFYRQQSTKVPKRPDGLPNRPLTAFTVTVFKAERKIR